VTAILGNVIHLGQKRATFLKSKIKKNLTLIVQGTAKKRAAPDQPATNLREIL
jgi:hypothetical protein